MKIYKTILVALELIPEVDNVIIQKIKDLLIEMHANVFLIHGVEYLSGISGGPYVSPGALDSGEEVIMAAKNALLEISQHLKSPAENIIVKAGSVKHLIIDEAKKIHADLIVVGSHGRHGIRLLLGSTANAVIHAAHCDVLTVRLK